VEEAPLTKSWDEVLEGWLAQMTPEERAEYDTHAEYYHRVYRLASEVMGLRRKHGLTQAQLAERCGVDQAEISRIETGNANPTARTLERIADALDADLHLVAR
jgi:DNA-binding XRE family transcriptional regulator